MLADRVKRIAMSQTLQVASMAREMRAKGIDVLDFSAGQPDFDTPQVIKDAGKRAIDDNQTRYTANEGLVELREAVVETIRNQHGIEYGAAEVVVSSGAKASLYFAFMALLDAGDEVLLPAPYWVSYPEQIGLAQGVPVVVPCAEDRGFKLSVEDLEARVTPRTKVLVLNYPSNPTGSCYTRSELEPIADFCVRRGLWIVADEIYSRLVYDGFEFASIASVSPEARERTVLIDGVSKTFAMTGWRIGWAAGPREVIGGMARVQSHSTSNACSIAQWASVEALRSAVAEAEARVSEFGRRRDEMVRLLRELPGVRCGVPEGSFYVFPEVAGCFGDATGDRPEIRSGKDFSAFLLERANVAVVPGEAFGSSEHVRFSYAVSVDRIREGVGRIAKALE